MRAGINIGKAGMGGRNMRNYAGLDNDSLNELAHEQAEEIKRLEAEVARLQETIDILTNPEQCTEPDWE